MGRIRNLWVLLGLLLFTVSINDFHVSADVIPSENECRPYIEKAIHELKNVDATASDDKESTEKLDDIDSIETDAAPETGTEDDGVDSVEDNSEKSIEDDKNDDNVSDAEAPSLENQTEENASNEDDEAQEKLAQENESKEQEDSKEQNDTAEEKSVEGDDDDSKEVKAEDNEDQVDTDGDSKEGDSKEQLDDDSKEQNDDDSNEPSDADSKEESSDDNTQDTDNDSKENEADDGNDTKENTAEDENDSKENDTDDDNNDSTQTEETLEQDSAEPAEAATESEQSNDESNEGSSENEKADSVEDGENQTVENEADSKEDDDATAEANDDSKEDSKENDSQDDKNETNEESAEEKVRSKRSIPEEADNTQSDEQQDSAQNDTDNDNDSQEAANDSNDNESLENTPEAQTDDDDASQEGESQEAAEDVSEEEQDEDDLTIEFEIPKNLRPRGHVSDLLGLDAESSIKENALKRTGDVVLKELKRVFDNAIKPLETMYKYRDLSNRHFGDPEIFSKPLVLFMGPWSGGKSTILNYLTGNEYTPNSIRSGAEPSPAYFNILMHGEEPEVLDGTQLAADWTFSGLQKFGQGLMDRLRGQKLPSKLLERVNIVEIPGILEVRKHVSRYFPFNDACQWFIDRADIIFLVYDPSKLDVGPETEAILDQLKGREYQTRILLNKADQVKPEELLRVQGALIWNISPLMSSAQPPVMYTVSLWSHPFESGAPIRLLQAQERAFLSDLREAIDKRIENKIASARRFAVRIRNHAKMVDCYLTTYYNQKGLFSNKKQVSDKIIEHPQNYNIYEGLSTLTNISRYDLPDPEVYLDFFRLNPLYEFKKLSETCTYFKGCPINKLDIAIAYELPELVGKYKKLQEQNLIQLRKEYDENCNQTETEPPVKIIKS